METPSRKSGTQNPRSDSQRGRTRKDSKKNSWKCNRYPTTTRVGVGATTAVKAVGVTTTATSGVHPEVAARVRVKAAAPTTIGTQSAAGATILTLMRKLTLKKSSV